MCDLGTKNYNRIFLSATRTLRKDGFSAARLKQFLLSQIGESSVWPDDASFHEAWVHDPLYGPLDNPKLVHLYLSLNKTFMSKKNEGVIVGNRLTIEHIMPRKWVPNWPLLDESIGMELGEMLQANENDPRLIATRARERAVNTLGNLTILSSSLNAAQSNSAGRRNDPRHSLLPINQRLFALDAWNETTIHDRGEKLFRRVVRIWPR